MKNNRSQPVRLNANENFYGCSPKVQLAIKKELKYIHLYPSLPVKLEEKLANLLCVKPENIVLGAGSVRLIDGIIQTFVDPDGEIIIFERSFIAYEQLAATYRRKYLLSRQRNFVCDINNIFPLITENTNVIFIANPNNPTGTIISHQQLVNLLSNIPENIIVVIDEAYCEYVTDKSFPNSPSLLAKHPNLIILRTFSKIYGLAGLRIGYGIMSSEMAAALKKNRIPFFMNSLAENAAIAALNDNKYMSSCVIQNSKERDYLYKKLKQSGFNVIPSQANFLYLYFNSEEVKEKLFGKFIENGLLICNLKVFGQGKSLRISMGNMNLRKKIIKCIS